MYFLKNIFRHFVYYNTKKPKCYVHIDEAKSLQDFRQIQYNNWCKRNAVYNGSYLPTNPNVLIHKGWIETTAKGNTSNKEYT